jgi:MATE family multidrug resistance protein
MGNNHTRSRQEARLILRLAWPIMLTNLNWTLMQLIDVVVVGRHGTADLAALAASRTVTFISIVFGLAGLSGVLVHVAQAEGAGRTAETGAVMRAGIAVGLCTGIAATVILWLLASPILVLIGVPPVLAEPGAAVVRAMALAFPAQLVIAAGSFVLEGMSRPRRVMAINLVMLPVNALLAWAWVGGHFGLPALGAVGAGLATAIVSFAGAFLTFAMLWSLADAPARAIRDWSGAAIRKSVTWIPRLVRFGIVPALAAALELAGFSWLMALSTQLGNAAAGAFQAMLAIHNIAFALSMGFGSAAGVRVGNAVGANERERAWSRVLIAGGLCTLVLGAASLLLVIEAPRLVQPFSTDPQVRDLAASMLAIHGAFLVFDGLQYVFGASLRSLGAQVRAGINSILSFFVVTGGLAWFLVRNGWGPDGLAYAAGTGMFVCAGLQFIGLVRSLAPGRGKSGNGAEIEA